jgi:hypothetical protein
MMTIHLDRAAISLGRRKFGCLPEMTHSLWPRARGLGRLCDGLVPRVTGTSSDRLSAEAHSSWSAGGLLPVLHAGQVGGDALKF